MSRAVLDASALLALINGERGGDVVWGALMADERPAVCTVNLSEVVARLAEWGSTAQDIAGVLDEMSFEAIAFDYDLAFQTGLLRPITKRAGLSLGDRACLALGAQLGVPVLTTDRSWESLGLPVELRVIR